jgi:hypothetical protein
MASTPNRSIIGQLSPRSPLTITKLTLDLYSSSMDASVGAAALQFPHHF